jgi:hypothetical protein
VTAAAGRRAQPENHVGSVIESIPVSLSPTGVLDIGSPSAGRIR